MGFPQEWTNEPLWIINFYTYDPQRRRLQNLTVNSGGNTIMDNAYTYDANSKYIN